MKDWIIVTMFILLTAQAFAFQALNDRAIRNLTITHALDIAELRRNQASEINIAEIRKNQGIIAAGLWEIHKGIEGYQDEVVEESNMEDGK